MKIIISSDDNITEFVVRRTSKENIHAYGLSILQFFLLTFLILDPEFQTIEGTLKLVLTALQLSFFVLFLATIIYISIKFSYKSKIIL